MHKLQSRDLPREQRGLGLRQLRGWVVCVVGHVGRLYAVRGRLSEHGHVARLLAVRGGDVLRGGRRRLHELCGGDVRIEQWSVGLLGMRRRELSTGDRLGVVRRLRSGTELGIHGGDGIVDLLDLCVGPVFHVGRGIV